ncbi:tRNA pseudouridine(13) synthase TruD [Haladaptatus sp. DYSN1]|uniref:tRNA pseudouridine(13) synthase TruD n=1 Tax=unclassified Haladaptatus TaxID=2622732 RepID=UPI00240527D9|nr:tRNA pseudouridine(13) synthase TruD [Haladaptatus sp. DYSN1]
MRAAHPVEQLVGIDHYVSDAEGIGGKLRVAPEDFRVRELERFSVEPVSADTGSYAYLVFRATLDSWDTNQFTKEVASRMGVSRERLSWAGTKDKHAVTTQLFSIYDADPEDLPDIPDADIEVLGRAGRGLQFGDLAGNEFEIRVRDADHPENVADITADLADFGGRDGIVGVPNFFGHQRFGSRRPVSHDVGLDIVRRDWEAAVMAYVANPSEREREQTREARRFVGETRDWKAALEDYPGYLHYERAMLHKLAENGGESPEDFREALETFPTNLQRLMVNAAQSYLFNQILSERLARGIPFDRAVAGDVVCFADADAPGDLVLPDTDREQAVTEKRVDTINRHCERGRAFVTAPLIGTETEFADGEPGEIAREVLEAEGLTREDFDLPGEFHSKGTRRAILLQTGLETADTTFTFSLPKGSYATVLMREYLKTDPDSM